MKNITGIYYNADRVIYDEKSKFVIMSDVHRGIGKRADDYSQNKTLYKNVLEKYYDNEFTYIELGDGEELWENRCVNKIINTNIEVYMLLRKFYDEKKLYLLWGNHDIIKKRKLFAAEKMYKFYNRKEKTHTELFKDIVIHEALVLQNKNFKGNIFLIHGHQVDFFNCGLWPMARFLARYFWKPLEYFGVRDPTRPAKAQSKKLLVERKLTEWILENKHMLIAGHTHKAMFSDFDVPPYFNDGCCVRKGELTAIEIEDEKITLIKWKQGNKGNGYERIVLGGPENISKYFKETC